jgi:hypothetical protein
LFWFGLLIISTKAKHFDLVCLLSERKQNVLIWSAYYRNKSKTIWFAPKIISAEGFYLIHTYMYLSTSKLYISKIKKVADSPYRWVGESPTPRISESGSRYLIYNKLQNLISQKVIKLFEQKFQRVFLYTYTASSANLSSLALS